MCTTHSARPSRAYARLLRAEETQVSPAGPPSYSARRLGTDVHNSLGPAKPGLRATFTRGGNPGFPRGPAFLLGASFGARCPQLTRPRQAGPTRDFYAWRKPR